MSMVICQSLPKVGRTPRSARVPLDPLCGAQNPLHESRQGRTPGRPAAIV